MLNSQKHREIMFNILKDIYKKLSSLPNNYKILDWLWEVLTEKQKYYVKNNLLKDLISNIEFKIKFN